MNNKNKGFIKCKICGVVPDIKEHELGFTMACLCNDSIAQHMREHEQIMIDTNLNISPKEDILNVLRISWDNSNV